MHALLRRQLKRHAAFGPDDIPDPLRALFAAVSEAYEQYDADRGMADRALELSNNELGEMNARVEHQKQELERSNTELEHFAYIASHDAPPVGTPLTVELTLPTTDQTFVLPAVVRWANTGDGIGVQFVGVDVDILLELNDYFATLTAP